MRKIGIIYGGRSTEHDASLKSKENFFKNLDKDQFDIVELIFVDRYGRIYLNKKEITIGQLSNKIKYEKDIYYLNLLHGQEGEDGSWSGIFDICDGKGTFEKVNTSSILMNKYQQGIVAKYSLDEVLMPQTVLIKENDILNLSQKLKKLKSDYIIVKPNNMGASHFTEKLLKKDIGKINTLISKIFEFDDEVVIQEFIEGEEYTCGVINYNNELKPLPIIHAKSKTGMLDHRVKHRQGNVKCDFNNFNEKSKIEKISIELFKLFEVIGMCRFDFIVTPDSKIYYLEGNLIPGFSNESAFPMMLREANISLTEFTINLFNAYDNHKLKNKYLSYKID